MHHCHQGSRDTAFVDEQKRFSEKELDPTSGSDPTQFNDKQIN